MPKQIWKIDKFHGGLNSNSHERDVADNELTAATDVMVDEVGRIRSMGKLVSGVSSPASSTINAGYGLFQFSADRVDGHLGEHLSNTGDFSSLWSGGTGWTLDSTDASYSHDASPADLIQTSTNRLEKGKVNTTYVFRYTISGFTDTISTLRILGGSGQFAASNTDLNKSNGTHFTTFTSNASTVDSPFTIDVASSGSGAFNIDNVSLKIYNATESGSDYLAFSNADGNGQVRVYSSKDTTWGNPITGLTSQTSGNRKDVFYYVDGALRVCDSEFGNSNDNKWYGYIERTLFSGSNTFSINSWSVENQKINNPLSSRFSSFIASSGVTYSQTGTVSVGGSVQSYVEPDNGTELGSTNVSRVTISWSAVSSDPEGFYTGDFDIKVGGWDGSVYTGTTKNGSGSFSSTDSTDTDTGEVVVTFSHSPADIDVSTGPTVNPKNVKVEMINISEFGSGTLKITNVKYESASGSESGHTNLGVENVEAEVFFSVPTNSDASGWGHSDGTTKWNWNVGVSFIYDENQESLITEMDEVFSGTHTAGNNLASMTDSSATFVIDNLIGDTIVNTTDGSSGEITDNTATNVTASLSGGTEDDWDTNDAYTITRKSVPALGTESPTIKLNFKYSSSWNTRITGAKLYMRKSQSDERGEWYPQVEYDFISGKAKSVLNGTEVDVEYNGSLDEYNFEMPNEKLQQPNLIGGYQSFTGYSENEKSILSKYKTAVVANRVCYIGNVEMQNEDGTFDINGDAMMKTPANRFDIFPISKIVEASIRDGDEIVKLEEYADRILQFKKKKMHIINVSQELEFLEDTFIHKGVSHPAATVKTDYGVAWVNKHGCYLYDGQRVINLLEKGGVQIIKESNWNSFTTDNSIIGYVPLKRQIIVVKDCTSSSDGHIYLYDMVTKSWVQGNTKFIDDKVKTNFINDENGDLMLFHTNGTSVKWSDTSNSGTASIITKEIDFGQPSIRKKVYKIYVTSKNASGPTISATDESGNSLTLDSTTLNSGSSFSETEHKITAGGNNVKSIKISISGSAASGFEISDMSIVYRNKRVK